jgi:eukaryotic-like serine/threonine-protein kinase
VAAKAQLQQAVRKAQPSWSHLALAQAGLARVALLQGQLTEARAWSDRSLATWAQVKGFRDMRMQPYLWRVQAAVLAAAGDAVAANNLRQQAQTAAQRYDVPSAPTVSNLFYVGL